MYCYRLLQASIAVLAVLTLVQAQKNTCIVKEPPGNADFCAQHGNAHLGCKNKGFQLWSKRCGKIKHIVFMSKEYRQMIVKTHNLYRNAIAKGKLTNVPMAARMLRLRWDVNLAKLADYAARQCRIKEPSKIFSTPQFKDPGFNAALSKFPKKEIQNEKFILKSHLRKWYEQYEHLNFKNLKSDVSPVCKETSHIKQMAVGLNNGIGCAVARFSDEHWVYQTTICLYGCRKKRNKRPYLVGKVPGSNCKCGVESDLKCLCKQSEPVPADCVEEKATNPIVEKTTTRKPTSKTTKKKIQSNVGRFINWLVDMKNSKRKDEVKVKDEDEYGDESDVDVNEDEETSLLSSESEDDEAK